MNKIIQLTTLSALLSITSCYAGWELPTWAKIKAWFTIKPGPKYRPLEEDFEKGIYFSRKTKYDIIPMIEGRYPIPQDLPKGNYTLTRVGGKVYLKQSSKTQENIQKKSKDQQEAPTKDVTVMGPSAYSKVKYHITKEGPNKLTGYQSPKVHKFSSKKTEEALKKYGAGWE